VIIFFWDMAWSSGRSSAIPVCPALYMRLESPTFDHHPRVLGHTNLPSDVQPAISPLPENLQK